MGMVGDDVLRRIVAARFTPSAVAMTLWPVSAATSLPCCCRMPPWTKPRLWRRCSAGCRRRLSVTGHPATKPPFLSACPSASRLFRGTPQSRNALLEVADARLRVSKSGGDADTHAHQVRRTLAESVGGFTMLDALVTAVDNKDRYTRRHSEDVMQYGLQIAQAIGLDAAKRSAR